MKLTGFVAALMRRVRHAGQPLHQPPIVKAGRSRTPSSTTSRVDQGAQPRGPPVHRNAPDARRQHPPSRPRCASPSSRWSTGRPARVHGDARPQRAPQLQLRPTAPQVTLRRPCPARPAGGVFPNRWQPDTPAKYRHYVRIAIRRSAASPNHYSHVADIRPMIPLGQFRHLHHRGGRRGLAIIDQHVAQEGAVRAGDGTAHQRTAQSQRRWCRCAGSRRPRARRCWRAGGARAFRLRRRRFRRHDADGDGGAALGAEEAQTRPRALAEDLEGLTVARGRCAAAHRRNDRVPRQ